MNLKLSQQAKKGVFKEVDIQKEAEEINKQIEILLKDQLPKLTSQTFSSKFKEYGEKALLIRTKITFVQKNIENLMKKGNFKEGKTLLLQKNFSLLGHYLKEGYHFIMKMRKEITQESMGYALRISDGKEESLGIYSLDEILPMTILAKSTEGNFSLAFKNVDIINKAANMQNELSLKFANELNTVLNFYKQIRKNVLTDRSKRRKAGEKTKDGNLISVYYPGMNGFLLERAFIAKAKGRKTVNNIFDFVMDTDRYSSGGDLQGTEVLFELRDTYRNIEVKNITEAGASLVQLDTLVRDLDKIIEICLKSKIQIEKNFIKKLNKEIFKNKGKVSVSSELIKILNQISTEVFDSIKT